MAVRIVMDPVGIARIHEAAGDFAQTVARFILLDILDEVPIDTGALLRSLHLERVRDGLRHSTRIWVGTDHWMYPEYGVDPHKITAHGPYRLRNRRTGWEGGHSVRHPGQRAQAYMRRNFYKRRIIVRWAPAIPGRPEIQTGPRLALPRGGR